MKKQLASNDYYSLEANKKYFSVSQLKDFMKCEAMAMAKIRGEYSQPTTRAMLTGSFVDAYFEGTLPEFMKCHPEIYTQKNALRADFKRANEIIARLHQDPLFMRFMGGKKQEIFTFQMFGAQWKIKMDSYIPGICITDLKVVANFKTLPNWRYDLQGSVYQKGVEIVTGEKLPFYLAVATKEKTPNFDIFQITQDLLDRALKEIELNIERYMDIKAGRTEPDRCESCEYCRRTKKSHIRSYKELLEV